MPQSRLGYNNTRHFWQVSPIVVGSEIKLWFGVHATGMGKQQLHSEFWWGNPLSKRALRERIRKWADNIKVNLRTLCCVDRRLITLVDDCVHIGNGSVDSTVVIRMTKKCRRCLGLSYTECLTPMRGSGKTEHTTGELRCLLVAKRRVKVASYWPSSHLAAL
ncbi:hypothetical protein L798_00930 [Zootermopsis nevadensis]|uniref:Uncharacterized protein n=1 Tax=Zootermopsis nevadensis TaxID=136037 RepID=A0A067QM57_ZOONE|nr:hypothetical protein L798_00930 [Zootermopsis nevadensis]